MRRAKSRAARKASGRLGSNLPVSMALMVCRDTSSASANWACVFDKWGEYLVDGPLAMALLDRLVERAIILKIKGKTYRTPLAKTEDNPA